jgi:hypothetical protein
MDQQVKEYQIYRVKIADVIKDYETYARNNGIVNEADGFGYISRKSVQFGKSPAVLGKIISNRHSL